MQDAGEDLVGEYQLSDEDESDGGEDEVMSDSGDEGPFPGAKGGSDSEEEEGSEEEVGMA